MLVPPLPSDWWFCLAIRTVWFIEHTQALYILAIVDVLALAVLVTVLRPGTSACGLRRLYRMACALALVAILPWIGGAVLQLRFATMSLARSGWLDILEPEVRFSGAFSLVMVAFAVVAAGPAVTSAWLAHERHHHLAHDDGDVALNSVRVASFLHAVPWAFLTWLLAYNYGARALHYFQSEGSLRPHHVRLLCVELILLALAVVAVSLPPRMARNSRRPSGPPAGFVSEPSRFQALTNASGRATLRPASHP